MLTGRDKVAVERIELQWELAEGLGERTTGLDISLDVEQQLADSRVGVPATDNVERLQ